jgi:hypothetical protein
MDRLESQWLDSVQYTYAIVSCEHALLQVDRVHKDNQI